MSLIVLYRCPLPSLRYRLSVSHMTTVPIVLLILGVRKKGAQKMVQMVLPEKAAPAPTRGIFLAAVTKMDQVTNTVVYV